MRYLPKDHCSYFHLQAHDSGAASGQHVVKAETKVDTEVPGGKPGTGQQSSTQTNWQESLHPFLPFLGHQGCSDCHGLVLRRSCSKRVCVWCTFVWAIMCSKIVPPSPYTCAHAWKD
jgi:hypothetical protein